MRWNNEAWGGARCYTDLNSWRSADLFWFFETSLKTGNIKGSSMSRWLHMSITFHIYSNTQCWTSWWSSFSASQHRLIQWIRLIRSELHLDARFRIPERFRFWESQMKHECWRDSVKLSSSLSFSSFDSLICFLNHCTERRSENT